MSLPPTDADFLAAKGIAYTTQPDRGMLCLVLHDWRVPAGYNRIKVDLLLRLPPGFPDVAPDMWWINPGLRLFNGQPIRAAEVTENYLGRTWQRWSRHFAPGQWKQGIDNLETFLARVRGDMRLSRERK